jgi:hypothetical protein
VAIHATELIRQNGLRAGADILVHSVRIAVSTGNSSIWQKAGTSVHHDADRDRRLRRSFGQDVKLTDIEQQLGSPGVATWSQLKPRRRKFPAACLLTSSGLPADAVHESPASGVHGIRIVAGTDAGTDAHGRIHRSSTMAPRVCGRRIFSWPRQKWRCGNGKGSGSGTLQKGKYADLVILDADPLRDIRNARKIFKVIKNGVILDISTNALK